MNNDEHRTSDHDLLIELRTEIKGIKDAIREMNDGTAATIKDHENRIRRLESWGLIAIGGLYVANILLGYYVLIHKS